MFLRNDGKKSLEMNALLYIRVVYSIYYLYIYLSAVAFAAVRHIGVELSLDLAPC